MVVKMCGHVTYWPIKHAIIVAIFESKDSFLVAKEVGRREGGVICTTKRRKSAFPTDNILTHFKNMAESINRCIHATDTQRNPEDKV